MTCYIEKCFIKKAKNHTSGENIINKWKSDKRAYRDRTSLTVFDFQHFSMHDESHSISILNYIELLLGKERINQLSMGDLWLILECSYFHDIGMTLTKDEREKLWKENEEFKKYIKERLKENELNTNRDLYRAAHYYKYIENLLNGKKTLDDLNEEASPAMDWPEVLIDRIRLLMTDFIRGYHADRCKDVLRQIVARDADFLDLAIEKRLYDLIAEISALHTKNFENILEQLRYEEIAFGDVYIHPQFIASLLRIGDLLDMDNNRFKVEVLEHIGKLPSSSDLHLKKHKALSNYNVTPTEIIAVARTDDFNVCKTIRDWFNMIEREVYDLKKYWNQIAPRQVKSCLLKSCSLTVYHKNNIFTSHNVDKFTFDSRKMQKLLIGDAIYSCRLDCIREYIQNAMDASKIKLWELLKQENSKYLFRNGHQSYGWLRTLPCDLKEDVFQQFPINIELSFCAAENTDKVDRIRITIRDQGIGMDAACVKAITTIGTGWRNRKEYQDVFDSAPKWLRPTGGFGIGIQSAFMLTDQVSYKTRSEKEPNGHIIKLLSPSKGGDVSDELCTALPRGTEVSFEIEAFKFLDHSELGLSKSVQKNVQEQMATSLSAMFSEQYLLELAVRICQSYIEEQIPNSLFPIYFGKSGQIPDLLASPCYYKRERETGPGARNHSLKMYDFKTINCLPGYSKDECGRYTYYIAAPEDLDDIDRRGQRIILWDRDNMDCVAFTFPDIPLNPNNPSNFMKPVTVTFKDVLVPGFDFDDIFTIPNTIYSYNILGETADSALQVSRAHVKREFEPIFLNRLTEYLRFADILLLQEYLQKDTKEFRDDYKRMLFALLSNIAFRDDAETIIRDLGLEKYQDSPFLSNVYRLKNNEDNWRIEEDTEAKALNVFLDLLKELKKTTPSDFKIYMLSTIQGLKGSDDNFDKEQLKIFTEEWAYGLKKLWLEGYKETEKNTIIPKQEPTKDGDSPPNLQYNILCYSLKSPAYEPTRDDNIGHTSIHFGDQGLAKLYPQLRVRNVPFPIAATTAPYAHIFPGKEFLKKLNIDLSQFWEIETVEQLIISDKEICNDFRRLVEWTYKYQFHEGDKSIVTYQEIKRTYLKWILLEKKQEHESSS